MSVGNRRKPKVVFHVLAAAAFSISIGTYICTYLASDEARIHALGRTFIFHANGQVAINTPSSPLVVCNLFTFVNPDWIWFTCAGYLACWLVMMWLTHVPRQPAGFPLD
jgi:hypothetical protein